MAVVTIDSCDELTQLLAGHTKVVVSFYAPWVAAAKQAAPIFEHLAATYKDSGVVYAKVDVDDNEDCAEEFGVTTVPAFVFFNGGQKQREVVGANPEQLTDAAEKFSGDSEKLRSNPSDSIASSAAG